MKKSLPKFLIAKNEAAKPGATYFVHTQEPEFIGELHRFESLLARNKFVADNEGKDLLQINPTTILVVSKYLSKVRIQDKSYLTKKIIHWIIDNYLNASVF